MRAHAVTVHLSGSSVIVGQVVREGFLEEAKPVWGLDRWLKF